MDGDQAPQTTVGNNQNGDGRAQVISKLQGGTNILVSVSADPSIDALSAAIALTLLLEKIKKNATAVFSGKVPQAIRFLKPGDTFEKNTDSLRDFIISIDKSKADKLRYKVEDNVVKIFITPYKTSITEQDLQYNAGDFNVDIIVALGVHHQQDLDLAITAHGRIFHDATVISINNVAGGDLGVANWEDFGASSLSEMISHLSDDMGQGLLDGNIATALLTGIVAETSRFSNEKTHPGTMTVSSKLLEAGADQQLVNSQLQNVIGSVVNLAAGTEIKPTESLAETPAGETEELVIGEDGSLESHEEAKAELKEDPKLEPVAPPDEPDFEIPQPEAVSQELLGTEITPTPAPVLDEAPVEPIKIVDPNESLETAITQANDGADIARTVDEAIERETAHDDAAPVSEPLQPFNPDLVRDAAAPLENQGEEEPAPVVAPTQPVVPGSGAFAASAPALPTFDPAQPFQNPLLPGAGYPAMAPPTAPQQAINEPAPLSASPADQAMTMPLPPPSAFAPPQPAYQPGPQPPMSPPPLPPAGYGQ